MACRHSGNLVFYHRVHFPDSEVDASSEHVLVVDCEPLGEDLNNLWNQDLVDWELTELFHLKDRKRLCSFGLVSKSLAVRRLGHLLAEILLNVAALRSVIKHQVVTDTSRSFVLEAFRSFHRHNRLDHAEALNG